MMGRPESLVITPRHQLAGSHIHALDPWSLFLDRIVDSAATCIYRHCLRAEIVESVESLGGMEGEREESAVIRA
jgi:hypothetical protein